MRDQPQSDVFFFLALLQIFMIGGSGRYLSEDFPLDFSESNENEWKCGGIFEMRKRPENCWSQRLVLFFFPYFSSVLVTCRVSPRVNDELADVSSTYGQMKVSDQLEGPSLVVSVHGHCGGGGTGPSHVIFTADNRISSSSFCVPQWGRSGKNAARNSRENSFVFRVRTVGESVNLNELNRTRQLFFKKFWLRCGQ